jgi:hypothetical protein
MTAWTRDELDKIANADELRLATTRPDGSLRDPVTIWVVRHGDDLYIRSYRGPSGSWFRRARERLDNQIDAAYRAKYRRYSGTYVDPMVAPQARATTIKLVPRADGS